MMVDDAHVFLDLAQARPVLERHGRSSFTAQALAPGYNYVALAGVVVPFCATRSAWVTAGPPVGPAAQIPEGAHRFVALAKAHRRRAVFFGVDTSFARAAGLHFTTLGQEPYWVPGAWHLGRPSHRSLRAQVRRAERRGVRVSRLALEAARSDPTLRRRVEALIGAWQAEQAMPPMGFLVAVNPFRPTVGQEVFLAEVGNELVGLSVLAPLGQGEAAKQGDETGWLLEHLVRGRGAPNGTAEALVAAAMAAHPQAPRITLGMVPLMGPLHPALRRLRRALGLFYSFEGLAAFKAKLKPQGTPAVGMAHGGRSRWWSRAWALREVLRAFARGSLLGFGLRLLGRGPRPLLRLLTALLPLWTLGLWALPTDLWFPAPWVQRAWVAFDVALCAALVVSLALDAPWLYGLLALVVGLDTAVTLGEALFFPGPQTPLGLAMHALGVLAPGLGAVMLTGAYLRARRRG